MTEPGERAPDEPRRFDGKDWLGAAGSVLAIALSVVGMNKEPVFRGWAVLLMVLAAGTGVAAIVLRRYRRATTSAALVLVLAAVAVLTVAPDPTPPPPAPTPTPQPQLALSQVAVTAPDGSGSVATLDITVRNTGDALAVLTGVDLVIDDFAYLPACIFGGNLEVSGQYLAELPDNPRPGQVVRVTLHQQIEPGGVDRFTIGLKAPALHGDDQASSLASFVYLLKASVVQDGDRPALDAGTALVDAGNALDANGTFYFGAAREATASDAGTQGVCGGEADCVRKQVSCWNTNRAALLPLLSRPATRSSGGDSAAAALGAG